jgi:hypothetical protein
MTLRRRVFSVLPFGQPVGPDHQLRDFRHSGFAPPSLDGFAFVGSLAVLVSYDFRPMTLRRRVSPVLLFLGATILSRFLI